MKQFETISSSGEILTQQGPRIIMTTIENKSIDLTD